MKFIINLLKYNISLLTLITVVIALVCIFSTKSKIKTTEINVSPPTVVAHGGAIQMLIDGKKVTFLATNSLEALNKNYREGLRLFETDFQWTSDNQLVAIHDWGKTWKDYFWDGSPDNASYVPSLKEFNELKMKHGLTQLTPDSLIEWLKDHKDAAIVTDIKRKNLEGLRQIATKDPDIACRQFIPQIYHFNELKAAQELGFEKIILTLYQLSKSEQDPKLLMDFIEESKLWAVTIHVDKIRESNLALEIEKRGKFVYAHPVVDPKVFAELSNIGVKGIYSYTLKPSQLIPGQPSK